MRLTPLRAEGRGANSFLVTMWPLFNPTNRPVLGCLGAISPVKKINKQTKTLENCRMMKMKT